MDSVLSTIKKSLIPFTDTLKKDITEDDIIALTEIKIKRISKYDSDRHLSKLTKDRETDIVEVSNDIKYIKEYTIRYFEHLLKKYGHLHERKTEIVNT